MKQNLDAYTFSGNWSFNLKLPLLSKIHSEYWSRSKNSSLRMILLKKGYVPFVIMDEHTIEPDPTIAQDAAIEFLIQNESLIIESIYKVFTTKINPKYAEWCGDDTWIPKMESAKDIGALLLLNEISVMINSKEGCSYIRFDFEYRGDEEHGIALILNRDRYIGDSSIGDMSYECVYQDLGLDKRKIWDAMYEEQKVAQTFVHKIIEKYNKFKPWQLEMTGDYFNGLLRKNETNKIIEEIKDNNWDINLRFYEDGQNIIDKAAYTNNTELLEFLLQNEGDLSQSIRNCIGHSKINAEAIKLLVKHGASVDIIYGHFNLTLLGNEIKKCATAYRRTVDSKDDNNEKYTKSMAEYTLAKTNMEFYISQGANPKSVTADGMGYLEMLTDSWYEGYLEKYNILAKMKEVIQEITNKLK